MREGALYEISTVGWVGLGELMRAARKALVLSDSWCRTWDGRWGGGGGTTAVSSGDPCIH